MYSYGNNPGFGWGGSGCYSGCGSFTTVPVCCGGSGFGSTAAIILVLFILLVIVLGSRFVGPVV